MILLIMLAASLVTQPVALAIAGIFAAFSPLFLKYVPLDNAQMTAFTMLVALLIAIVASWLTGDLELTRESVISALLGSAALWAIQQAVYAVLRQAKPAAVAGA
jgi:hypothetical protein